jgi:nicotinate phosphoribosyltransferase
MRETRKRCALHGSYEVVAAAANGKTILYFPARHDHWMMQTGDG